MNKAFWVIVAADAAVLLFLFAFTLLQSGSPNGGREMSLAIMRCPPNYAGPMTKHIA